MSSNAHSSKGRRRISSPPAARGAGMATRIFILPPRKRPLCGMRSIQRQRSSPAGSSGKRPTSNVEHPTPNDSDGGGTKPLQGVLEKSVLERRLKWTGVGFANSKLRSDFELGGAMNFDIHSSALCQGRPHRLERQL